MSTDVFETDGLLVTRYCGPERDDDVSRVRFQLTLPCGDDVTSLSVEEAHELARDLAASVAEYHRPNPEEVAERG